MYDAPHKNIWKQHQLVALTFVHVVFLFEQILFLYAQVIKISSFPNNDRVTRVDRERSEFHTNTSS